MQEESTRRELGLFLMLAKPTLRIERVTPNADARQLAVPGRLGISYWGGGCWQHAASPGDFVQHRFFIALAVAAACGCGEEVVTLPALQASSAHFRYFATSAERVPPGVLDRLERHREDVLGYFGISDESVIDYYRFDEVEDFNRLDRCRDTLGCTRGREVYTTLVFDQHELVHAYLSDWQPVSVLVEGVAEALPCGEVLHDWMFTLPLKKHWQEVVGQPPTDRDVYKWGVRLVLHLLRAHGPERFISYYRSVLDSDDPALFALDFERFWGEPLDGVWATLVEELEETPHPICPCRQPAMPADGSPIAVSAFDDYQVLPPVANDQTIILSTTADGSLVGACDGASRIRLGASSSAASNGLLAALRLDTARYFVAWRSAGAAAVSSSPLIQQDCASAGLLAVPSEVDLIAFVTPVQSGLAWYAGVSGPVLIRRIDRNPVSVTLAGDCSATSRVISISRNMGVSLQTGVFGMTPSAAPENGPAGLQTLLFDIFR